MRFRHGILGAVAVWGIVSFAGQVRAAEAEQCKLELVRLESKGPGNSFPQSEWIFRNVSAQYFFMQINGDQTYGNNENEFKEAVQKEPEKYIAKHPFRCVAKLGSKKYGFVFDKKGEDSKGLDRLYFDRNGNGDLTDDQPLDAPREEKPSGYPEFYEQIRFPRVDLPLEVEGKKLDYSFFLEATSNGSEPNQYCQASLTSAVYCRGEITLDGKTVQIAVLDQNSDGRFDDVTSLLENAHGPHGELYPQYGDMLLVDPQDVPVRDLQDPASRSRHQQYLSKLNSLAGKFYEVKMSPVGEEMTLTPSAAPLGKVASPHAPCTVELIGDLGYISLALEKSEPTEIPAGQWRLLSYTLKIENWKEPEKKPEVKKEENDEKKSDAKPSLFNTLKKALVSSAPKTSIESMPMYGPQNQSLLSARGTKDGKSISVEADQTTALEFGPPYKLRVKVQYPSPGNANLMLAIIGADGEAVSNLYVNGRRPPKPKLTITDPQGEVVVRGDFEYG
jgi:hypothetical protein